MKLLNKIPKAESFICGHLQFGLVQFNCGCFGARKQLNELQQTKLCKLNRKLKRKETIAAYLFWNWFVVVDD